nr:unnamed protein product [Spirometra erinaceieuropaei]
MTSLSLVLLFAVAHALVCQASPAYEILEADDEEGLSEALKWEGPEAKEAVQDQGDEEEEEEEEKRSSELKADGEELEAGLVEGTLAPARSRRGILCVRVIRCITKLVSKCLFFSSSSSSSSNNMASRFSLQQMNANDRRRMDFFTFIYKITRSNSTLLRLLC